MLSWMTLKHGCEKTRSMDASCGSKKLRVSQEVDILAFHVMLSPIQILRACSIERAKHCKELMYGLLQLRNNVSDGLLRTFG